MGALYALLVVTFFVIVFFLLRTVAVIGCIIWARTQTNVSLSSTTAALPDSIRTLVILGSGGHTAEMMSVMEGLDRTRYQPIIYVRAVTDTSSEVRIKRKEEERGNQQNCTYLTIPRSREVGQSYLSSIRTTLIALFHSIWIVLNQSPDVVLCNGPGTGVPICVMTFLANILLLRHCRIIFIESFCRVKSLSMSGLMLYPIVDQFIVQWPQLDRQQQSPPTQMTNQTTPSDTCSWRGVKYIGRLC